jgi:Aminoglycoside-2''-adenylyltransferase
VAERLADVDVPWCVVAGWALDLFRGHETREHEDLEIAVPVGRFDVIRAALADFEFEVVGSGRRWPLDSPAFDVMTQTWARDPDNGVYRLDISGSRTRAIPGSVAVRRASGCRTNRSS